MVPEQLQKLGGNSFKRPLASTILYGFSSFLLFHSQTQIANTLTYALLSTSLSHSLTGTHPPPSPPSFHDKITRKLFRSLMASASLFN